MKKIFSALFALIILFASSCTERTCPTYAKAPLENTDSLQDGQSL
ncbi:hypothetical protein BH23BAC1_BH23BAC1_03170 [soil metagenome]